MVRGVPNLALQFQEELQILCHLQHLISPIIGHQKRHNKNMSSFWTLVYGLTHFSTAASAAAGSGAHMVYQPLGVITSRFGTPIQILICSSMMGLHPRDPTWSGTNPTKLSP
jgi:hypothetical protein